ncbi:MAG: hypothetical protein GXY74_10365 [Phycisphaerae bacterium]|nr:hypothetical protein [Phycisphaerae bacterium]
MRVAGKVAAGGVAVLWMWAWAGAALAQQGGGGPAQPPRDAAVAEQPVTTGWSATTLDEDHEAAKETRAALNSGKVFDADFHIVETAGLTPEQIAAAKSRITTHLVQCRSLFPAVPRFAFADGAEFSLSDSSKPTITFLHGMADDPRGQPSLFRLPTRQKRQVYLVYVARDTYGNLQEVHLLLWKTAAGWRAADLHIHAAKLSGLDAAKAAAAAETETAAGRHVLGLALYSAAGVMAPRTGYRHGGVLRRIQEPIASLAKQLGLPERPIEMLHVGKAAVALRGASAVSFKGQLYLLLWHDCPAGVVEDEAVASVQGTLAFECLSRWPQTKAYFWGIALATQVAVEGGPPRAVNNSFSVADLQKAASSPQMPPGTDRQPPVGQ